MFVVLQKLKTNFQKSFVLNVDLKHFINVLYWTVEDFLISTESLFSDFLDITRITKETKETK